MLGNKFIPFLAESLMEKSIPLLRLYAPQGVNILFTAAQTSRKAKFLSWLICTASTGLLGACERPASLIWALKNSAMDSWGERQTTRQHEHTSVNRKSKKRGTRNTLPQSLQREYFLHRGVWLVLSSDCQLWALVLVLRPLQWWSTSPAERLLVSARPLKEREHEALHQKTVTFCVLRSIILSGNTAVTNL